MLILNKKKDIRVNLLSIPVDEQFKTVHIATDELFYKFIVSQINVIQNYLLFELKKAK
jgi:hypothetical protein